MIYDPSAMVARTIDITGLDRFIDVTESRVTTPPHPAGATEHHPTPLHATPGGAVESIRRLSTPLATLDVTLPSIETEDR